MSNSKDAEPLPAGTASALAMASQDAPRQNIAHTLGAGHVECTMGTPILLLTLASQNLLAYARTLAAKAEGEFYQFAVVFAHAACELHTEWAVDRLLAARSDRTLAALALPAESDVMSLETARTRRVYIALTGDDPTKAQWWQDWKDSRQDRHDVAHRGAQMTHAKAVKAIDLADRYIKHLTEKVEAALGRPP